MVRHNKEKGKYHRSNRLAAAGMVVLAAGTVIVGCRQVTSGQGELTLQTEQAQLSTQAEQMQTATQTQAGTQPQLLPGASGTLSPEMEFDRLWRGTYRGTTSTGLTAFYIEQTGPEATPESAKAVVKTAYCIKVYLADLQTQEETSFLCGVDFDNANTLQYQYEGVTVKITRNENNTVTVAHTGDLGVQFNPDGVYTLITR